MSESEAWPVAGYLQDDRYGLRAPVPADAERAGAWHEGAFPVTPDAARALLTRQETIPFGNNPTIRLMIVELASQEVVGGATVARDDGRVSKLRITVGGPEPSGVDAQRVAAAVLRLLVPWVLEELGLMTTVIDVPADEAILIAAARDLGMVEAVRLRQHIARPAGRVDLLMLERVNRGWGVGDA